MVNGRRLLRSSGIYLSVFLLLFVVIAPFYWIFTGSIKSTKELMNRIPTLFPQSLSLQHYRDLFASSAYPQYLLNSAIVAFVTMAITVIIATLAAYSIYRLHFPGRNFLSRVILVTYAFPGILLLVPLYSMMTKLHLIDSLAALVIVDVTFAVPFAVWMLRAFFRGVPIELEDAAALDGANHIQTMSLIMVPLIAPGIASIAIYAFISSWTEYIFASILIIGDANRTMPVGLAGIVGQYQVDWGLLAAGATIASLPVLILFGLVGRNFVEGLVSGAIK
jgi:multiple sugar transport system permease protein